MFKFIGDIINTKVSGQGLEDYYRSRRLIDAYFEDEETRNQPFREARRPNRGCDDFEQYKDYIVEHFSDPLGDKYRVLIPTQNPGGRFGNGGGMFDSGLEFNRKGDAYNYIDEAY